MADQVLVKHNGGGLFHIGIPNPTPGQQGEKFADSIPLRPGHNTVSSDKWALAEANKIIQYHLKHPKKNPMLEVVVRYKEGEYPLAKMTVDEACEVIVATANDDILSEWQGFEKRGGVLKAIAKQQKLLKGDEDE